MSTDADILALRERVAVKLGWEEICGNWFPKDQYQGSGHVEMNPPTLAELCKPMLKFLCKHTTEVIIDPHTNGLGCDIRVDPDHGKEVFGEHDTDPALALAMAVDALEVEA